MKIAITTSSFGKFSAEPLNLLKEKGLELVFNGYGRTLKPEEVSEQLSGCAGVIAGTERYGAGLLESLPCLKVISRCGVGMDGIDFEAAGKLGIVVRNTPCAPTQAVAELVVGMAFDLARGISRQDRDIRAGQWQKYMGRLVSAMKIGIIGMGRIGRAVEEKFSALGAVCAYSDPYVKNGPCARVELDELLGWADLISVHVPGNPNGRPVLDASKLALLRQGACLINCSRGGVVDESALYSALESGHLSGAALDVFADEPYKGPLAGLENVVLTPHVGSYARESRIEMEIESAENLIAELGI